MNLAGFSIRHPVAITMLMIGLIVMGLFSYSRIKLDMLPKIDIPIITVSTVYPGADPQNVETLISKRIEDAVSSVNGIDNIRSDSLDGFSNVIIEFDEDVKVDVVAADVREKVAAIRNQLPDDAKEPVILKLDINALPVMTLGISGERSAERVYAIAKDIIKKALQQVDGVADIGFIGAREREIAVYMKHAVLKEYGISPFTLAAIIAQKNLNLPSGHITRDHDELSIRMLGEFTSVVEIEELEIPMANGKLLKLKELADVRDTYEEYRQGVRLNGKSSVAMIIKKRSDANTVNTAKNLRESISEIGEKLPGDLSITIVRDRSLFILDSVSDLNSNLILGISITLFILYIFLHSLKLTLIAGSSIPIAIIASYTLVYMFGFSLNMMTLMAMAISVGLLVSNAIVVIENIATFLQKQKSMLDAKKAETGSAKLSPSFSSTHRRKLESQAEIIKHHLHRQEDPAEQGANEIMTAVFGATMTNIVVFVPIAFMEGTVGRFFYEFGMTVTFATFFSLLVAFTLVPMLSAKLLTEKDVDTSKSGWFAKKWEHLYEKLANDYQTMISWCLGHKLVTLGVAMGFSFSCMLLAPFIGFEFVTEPDQREFDISIEMPPGTSLAQTSATLIKIENILKKFPEVKTVFTKAGKTETLVGGATLGTQLGEVSVKLFPQSMYPISTNDFMSQLNPALARLPNVKLNVRATGVMGSFESALQIDVTGNDLNELRKIGQQVLAIVQKTKGASGIITSDKPEKPEFRIKPIRENLARYGITESYLGMALRSSFEGMVMSQYREKDDDYDIRVRLTDDFKNDLSSLQKLNIVSPQGVTIPLTHLAEIEENLIPVQIKRKYRNKWINISANVVGRSLGEIVRDIKAETDLISLPLGFNITYTGMVKRMNEAFSNLLTAGVLALIFTYLLLASLLESFIHPLTILISFPMAFGGIFLGLFLSGQTLSVFSLMAVVMLIGIVVNNGILLIERYRLLQDTGSTLLDSVIKGSPMVLRPIIMTTISAVGAMIPQALSLGTGGEMRAAMGTVSIGGLLASSILSVFIIPLIYFEVESIKTQFAANAQKTKNTEENGQENLTHEVTAS